MDEPLNTGWALYVDNDLIVNTDNDKDYTGGIALTLSGARAKQYFWSPFGVRRFMALGKSITSSGTKNCDCTPPSICVSSNTSPSTSTSNNSGDMTIGIEDDASITFRIISRAFGLPLAAIAPIFQTVKTSLSKLVVPT